MVLRMDEPNNSDAGNNVDALTAELREAVRNQDADAASKILAKLARNIGRETFENELSEDESKSSIARGVDLKVRVP